MPRIADAVGNSFLPTVTNTYDLGGPSGEWRDLYVDGVANIDSLLVDSATIGFIVIDSADINGGTIDNTVIGATTPAVATFTNLTVTGTFTGPPASPGTGTFVDLVATGNVDLGDATSDTVTITGRIDSNIVPSTDNTYDLGSSSNEWRDLYVDGTAYVDAINLNGTAITSTATELNILDGVTVTAAQINALGSGGLLGSVSFLTSGTTYTTPAGARALKVTVIGAGGGAGGVTAGGSGTFACSGGGGGGGWVTAWIFSPAPSYTYAIGAGGTGGPSGNISATQGSLTSWSDGTNTIQATAGSGGNGGVGGSSSSLSNGGSAGLGSRVSGTWSFQRGEGVVGAPGGDLAGDRAFMSTNGFCPLVGGGGVSANSGAPGANGERVGEGGIATSAWDVASGTTYAGGNGGPGVIIVEVYY